MNDASKVDPILFLYLPFYDLVFSFYQCLEIFWPL